MMKMHEEVYDYLLDCYEGSSDEGFEVVEAGEWQVDHKYESKRNVVKHIESGRFFALYGSRSGSYFSHYEYEELETDKDGMVVLDEVRPVERTIVEYI
jgi:hypothetical protein